MIRVGSLFAGIGGFDLGLERAGMKVVYHCENNDYCRRVLHKHWPDVPCYPDITELRGWNAPEVDLLCGGFPCQDISSAGLGVGISGARSGLWGEMARVVAESQPRWVIIENVPNIRTKGLGTVLQDLADIGYDAEWDCLSAAAFGAPHLRKRWWCVAYTHQKSKHDVAVDAEVASASQFVGDAHGTRANIYASSSGSWQAASESSTGARTGGSRGTAVVADTDKFGRGGWSGPFGETNGRRQLTDSGDTLADTDAARLQGCGRSVVGSGEGTPAESGAAARAEYGYEDHWVSESGIRRVADGIPKRMDRLRCLGNALVPQIAQWIGEQIMAYEGL